MNEKSQKIVILQKICDWCGKLLPLSHESKNIVCSNCYRLLLGAGISNADIFEKDVDRSV